MLRFPCFTNVHDDCRDAPTVRVPNDLHVRNGNRSPVRAHNTPALDRSPLAEREENMRAHDIRPGAGKSPPSKKPRVARVLQLPAAAATAIRLKSQNEYRQPLHFASRPRPE